MDTPQVAFRVNNDALSAAVSWVAKALPTKPTQAVLRGMLITAKDDELTFSGYDYEVSTEVRIPGHVEEPGRIAVAGKLIADITAALPKKEVSITFDGSVVHLECGAAQFELPSIELSDYPPLPDLPEDTGTVHPGLFAQAVSQVAEAASTDEALAILTGIYVGIDGNDMTLAATDRYRLSVRKLEWHSFNENLKTELVIPAKNLLDHARSMDALSSEDITLALGAGDAVKEANLFGVHAEGRKTTTRLLNADFPNFRPLLPKEHHSIASVNIEALLDALKRLSLVTDRSGRIQVEFEPGQLRLTAGGADSGRAEEIVDCAYVGEPITTAFNSGYLRGGLRAMGSERVLFGFTSAIRPAVMVPEPDELPEADENGHFPQFESDYTYLLMPVRTA